MRFKEAEPTFSTELYKEVKLSLFTDSKLWTVCHGMTAMFPISITHFYMENIVREKEKL